MHKSMNTPQEHQWRINRVVAVVEAGQVWRSISIPAFVPNSACHLISPCLSSPSAIESANTILFILAPQTDWVRNSSACPVAPLGIIKKIINNNRNIYCCMSTADLLATCHFLRLLCSHHLPNYSHLSSNNG